MELPDKPGFGAFHRLSLCCFVPCLHNLCCIYAKNDGFHRIINAVLYSVYTVLCYICAKNDGFHRADPHPGRSV